MVPPPVAERKEGEKLQTPTLRSGSRQARRSSRVIPFPVFELYGDQILEWLSAIDGNKPTRRTVLRVVKSMRCAVANAGRVRNSMRHSNLADLLRHAANALEAAEWDGTRYLLITALALMTAGTVSAKTQIESAKSR